MGYIDQTNHTLTCDCGESERQTIYERGSQYGASWGHGKPFDKFAVTWKDGDFRGPEIARAICNKCDKVAAISIT